MNIPFLNSCTSPSFPPGHVAALSAIACSRSMQNLLPIRAAEAVIGRKMCYGSRRILRGLSLSISLLYLPIFSNEDGVSETAMARQTAQEARDSRSDRFRALAARREPAAARARAASLTSQDNAAKTHSQVQWKLSLCCICWAFRKPNVCVVDEFPCAGQRQGVGLGQHPRPHCPMLYFSEPADKFP